MEIQARIAGFVTLGQQLMNKNNPALEEIKHQALKKWELLDVRIIHRFGYLSLGEQIMMVAVASAHRREAFEAADYIMDFLKSRAPFWKKEHSVDGSNWVNVNPEDEKSLTRW